MSEKSKLEQAIEVAIDAADSTRKGAMWCAGIVGAVILIATLAKMFGITSQYVPTFANWQQAGWAGVAYFGFSR